MIHELNQLIARDAETHALDLDALIREIARLRAQVVKLRNLNAALTGAGYTVVQAIQRAGGWSAEAPHIQPIADALNALGMAVANNLQAFEELHDEELQCA